MGQPDPPIRIEPPTCDDRPLWDVFTSVNHFPTLVIADELGLFAFLDRTPSGPEELARGLSIGPRGAEVMLGILASLGFLILRDGRFRLTDVSRNFLLPDRPFYWGGMLARFRSQNLVTRYRESLATDAAGDHLELVYEFPGDHARVFIAAMHSHSFPAATGVARRGDFSGVRRLLDAGGGSGASSIAISLLHPDIQCTVMDLPVVCEETKQYVARYGLEGRIGLIGLDMWSDPWPSGFDAVYFSDVLNDWDPARQAELVGQAQQAVVPGGRIYIHEMLLAEGKDGPRTVASQSAHMLLRASGKQHSFPELQDLLTQAGFRDVRVTETYGYFSLVDARKPAAG